MERHPYKLGAATLLVGAGIFFGIKPQEHIMSSDDWFTRERILSSYPFTYEAVDYLNDIPYFDRKTTTNGGGYAHNDDFPYGDWSETFSDQDEAILHEYSHIWYWHMVDQNPKFPEEVMNAMQVAVAEDKPGGYFKHLDWGFSQDWKGIDHSDATEWYASTASQFMGNLYAMPEVLHDMYKSEFRMDEQAKKIPVNPISPGKIKLYGEDSQK